MSCPICDKESTAENRPFCSRRCADLDLGNWLTGRYSVPSAELEDNVEPDRFPSKPDHKLH